MARLLDIPSTTPRSSSAGASRWNAACAILLGLPFLCIPAAANPPRSIGYNGTPLGEDDPMVIRGRAVAKELEAKLGARISSPVVFDGFVNQDTLDIPKSVLEQVGQIFAVVNAFEPPPGDLLDERGRHRPWVPQKKGDQMHTCVVSIFLPTIEFGTLRLDNVLAHELFHCYQYDIIGPERMRRTPKWIREGTAMWVGEMYSGGTDQGEAAWRQYLANPPLDEEPVSLFDRAYDAHGFFYHLENNGVNVWRLVMDLFRRVPADTDAAYFRYLERVAGEQTMSEWPMGLARMPGLGSGWDTDGLRIPEADSRRLPVTLERPPNYNWSQVDTGLNTGWGKEFSDEARRTFRTVRLEADGAFEDELKPGAQDYFFVEFPTSRVIRTSVTGHGGLRFNYYEPDGETRRFNRNLEEAYCIGDTCDCEDGNPPPGVESLTSQYVGLAATGTTDPGRVSLVVEEPNCTTCASTDARLDPCMIGTWEMERDSMVLTLLPSIRPGAVLAQALGPIMRSLGNAEALTKIGGDPDTDAEVSGSVRLEVSPDGTFVQRHQAVRLVSDKAAAAPVISKTLKAPVMSKSVTAEYQGDVTGCLAPKTKQGPGPMVPFLQISDVHNGVKESVLAELPDGETQDIAGNAAFGARLPRAWGVMPLAGYECKDDRLQLFGQTYRRVSK